MLSRTTSLATAATRQQWQQNLVPFSSILQKRTQSTTSSSSTQSTKPLKPLTPSQRSFLSSALRVNQAGELAATLIYTAQTPPLLARDPSLRPLMAHMYDQEAAHLSTFNALLAKHRVLICAL